MALDVAYDRAALDRLISSSLWLRDVPGGIRAVVAVYRLRLVVSGSTFPGVSPVAGSLRANPAREATRAARQDR